jgi:hypothetical protein
MTVIDQPKRRLSGAERAAAVAENVAIFVIVFAVLAAALATSFTHMHDWTVRALVATGLPHLDAASASPYGWSNAVISELIPLAGLLALRRRLVAGQSAMSYPLGLVIVGTAISVLAQLAWVSGSADGVVAAGFLAILPAIAAGAMLKLALSILDSARAERVAEDAADRKAAAEADRVRRLIARAEAEAEEARKAEAEARAEAEAEARRRAEAEALAEAERRARAEAEDERRAEVGHFRSAEETAAEAARRSAEEAAEARRHAARVQAELDQTRAAYQKAQEDLAVATELLDAEPAAPISAPPDNVRRLPQHRRPTPVLVEIPDQLPKIPEVSAELAERIAQVVRTNPSLTKKEIAELAGTSDRTVRNFFRGLTEREEVSS